MKSPTNTSTPRLEWHILTLEATPERARSIWQNEQLAFYRELLAAREALADARDFVDHHSEPWYKRGQELLAQIDAVLPAPSEGAR